MISDRRRRRRHRQNVARALRRKELRRNKREAVRNRVKQFAAARWLTGWFRRTKKAAAA